MRFVDQFHVILLDMAKTFMFGVDRFSEDENFTVTYRQVGGKTLDDQRVQQVIRVVIETMQTDYDQWTVSLPFPAVRHYLSTLADSTRTDTKGLPASEIDLLEQTFAIHEVGTIPETHAEALRELRQTHRLGVISDIFSPSALFLHEFERAGVQDLFDLVLFSSEHGYVKPASFPFQKAVSVFQEERSKIVFVGDNFKRDIVGAKGVGLAAVWINAQQDQRADEAAEADQNVQPDLIIRNLSELLAETGAKHVDDKKGHST